MIKKEMIAMLLAGGQGSRLGVLTEKVAKPAVAFGGKYRIIFHLRWKTSKLAKAILQEYGILKGKGRVAAAAAMEHGILLTEDLFSTVCSTYPCTKH